MSGKMIVKDTHVIKYGKNKNLLENEKELLEELSSKEDLKIFCDTQGHCKINGENYEFLNLRICAKVK